MGLESLVCAMLYFVLFALVDDTRHKPEQSTWPFFGEIPVKMKRYCVSIFSILVTEDLVRAQGSQSVRVFIITPGR